MLIVEATAKKQEEDVTFTLACVHVCVCDHALLMSPINLVINPEYI